MRPYSRSEEHVGEWKVLLRADSLEELFAEAARVVSRECGSPAGPPGQWEQVTLLSRDTETLLADWLNELLGRSEVRRRAFGEVRGLRIAAGGLEAEVRGRPVETWESPLKAATYHGLRLRRQTGDPGREDRWEAVVLFDV